MRKISPVLIILYLFLAVSFVIQILSGFFMRGNHILYSLHVVNIWILMVLVVLHWITAITGVRVWLNRRAQRRAAAKAAEKKAAKAAVDAVRKEAADRTDG